MCPNNCYNELKISGPKTILKEFVEFAKENDCELSANKFIPYPSTWAAMDKDCPVNKLGIDHYSQEYKDELIRYKEKWGTDKDGFNSGGYEWRLQNWNTKWGMYEISVNIKPLSVLYVFDSAWSPPTTVIKKMAEVFPKLRFSLYYAEGGNGFQGKLICKNGKVVKEIEKEYRGRLGG